MDSTPPASTRSISPARMARKAVPTASISEPHRRFMVVPGTDAGSPASSADMRATLRLSSPAWLAQPMITSSIAVGSSSGACSSTALNTWAARSSGRTPDRVPPKRPMAERRGWQIYTLLMTVLACDSLAGVMGGGARLEFAQHGQFLLGRHWRGVQAVGKADFPAGGLDHLLTGHARVQGGHYQLPGLLIRLENAQVGNHHGRATTDIGYVVTGLAIPPEANGGDEIHIFDEGTLGVLDGD